MPKKKAAKHYFKPAQTTHNASAAAGDSSSKTKSVNEILAGLRRSGPGIPAGAAASMTSHEPTLPPDVRQVLQIPDTPAPRPRRPIGSNWRRLPAGPPAPLSWQARTTARQQGPSAADLARELSRSIGLGQTRAGVLDRKLPGTYNPARGSLLDLVLKVTAQDWEYQAAYNRFHLYALPSRVRVSLIRYVSLWGPKGVSAYDLRLLLLPPSTEELKVYGIEEEIDALNEDVFQLDISGSPGRSVKIKELADLLFPRRHGEDTELIDSWEVAASLPPLPHLIPNLTHLSLAIMPLQTSALAPVPATAPSWHEFLALAPKLSALTHLSLAHWPVPSRTQNAKLATFVPPAEAGGMSRVMQYGGTGPYSHSLDDDFSEAVNVLRHLSRALYRLEYLDLTGCAAWCIPGLTRADSGGNYVDWLGDWGKLTVLRVGSGETGSVQHPVTLAPPDAETALKGEARERVLGARRLERHVIARRSGRGRPIAVETDWEDTI